MNSPDAATIAPIRIERGRGRGQQPENHRDGIAGAHAPAHPEISALRHDADSTLRRRSATASKTWSTVIESIAGRNRCRADKWCR